MLSPEQIENAIIAVEPREGEDTFRMEDILKVIEDNKDEVSVPWGESLSTAFEARHCLLRSL